MILLSFIVLSIDLFFNMPVVFGTQVSLKNRRTAKRTCKSEHFVLFMVFIFYLKCLGFKLLNIVVVIFAVNYLAEIQCKSLCLHSLHPDFFCRPKAVNTIYRLKTIVLLFCKTNHFKYFFYYLLS